MTRGKPVGSELHLDLHDDAHLALTAGRVEFLSMGARGLVEPRVMRDVGRVQADVKFAARPHIKVGAPHA